MRRSTALGALALAASLTAVAFGPVVDTFTTQDVRGHEQKHEVWASGLALDPTVRASQGPAACEEGEAAQYACDGIDMLSFTHSSEFGSTASALGSSGVSDVWGWTAEDGSEYAIVGKTTGVAFMDVSEPTAPRLLGNLDSPVAADLIWFDIKVVNDHAYIVSESAGHGLLVFDLTQLEGVEEDAEREWQPTSVYPLTGSAHNIVSNEAAEMVYVVGGNNGLVAEDQCRAGLHAIDVSTPDVPVFAGCYLEEGGFGVAGSLVGPAGALSRYVHDAHCVRYDGPDDEHDGKDICLTSAEDHVSIVDMSNPALPVLLSTIEYDSPSYTHQGWLSVDHGTFFLGDELDEDVDPGNIPTRTIVMDVTDLDQGTVDFVHEHDFNAIDHNMYTRADALFQSNYTVGLRVLDTREVAENRLPEAAFFDVHPSSDNTEFSGTWSNYPYFDSGTVVVTGYDGVWLLRLQDEVSEDLGLSESAEVEGELVELPGQASDRAREARARRDR